MAEKERGMTGWLGKLVDKTHLDCFFLNLECERARAIVLVIKNERILKICCLEHGTGLTKPAGQSSPVLSSPVRSGQSSTC